MPSPAKLVRAKQIIHLQAVRRFSHPQWEGMAQQLAQLPDIFDAGPIRNAVQC